jgi:DNA-binding NarL/FixJ family response regulator
MALLADTACLLGRDHEIVGAVTNGRELLKAAGSLDPDLIVLDISMPILDGFEAARLLEQAGCRSKLVFLTVWDDADYAREAMALGAAAYVVKSRLAADLPTAITAAMADQHFVSPSITL